MFNPISPVLKNLKIRPLKVICELSIYHFRLIILTLLFDGKRSEMKSFPKLKKVFFCSFQKRYIAKEKVSKCVKVLKKGKEERPRILANQAITKENNNNFMNVSYHAISIQCFMDTTQRKCRLQKNWLAVEVVPK